MSRVGSQALTQRWRACRHAWAAPEWRASAFDRFSKAVDLPMAILAMVWILLLVIPWAMDVSPQFAAIARSVDLFLWGVFALEYVIKITLVPNRGYWFRHNLIDLVVVAVPWLRPLRVLRSARALRAVRLTRVAALAGSGTQKAKRSAHLQGVKYVALVTGALILVSSVVMNDLERDVPHSTIHSWPDGLWWAVSTVSTVGYGDTAPVTAGGRLIAVVLMMTGIAFVGIITAALATYFVEKNSSRASGDATSAGSSTELQLDEVLERLASLEAAVTTAGPANGRRTLEAIDGGNGCALPNSEGTDRAQSRTSPNTAPVKKRHRTVTSRRYHERL